MLTNAYIIALDTNRPALQVTARSIAQYLNISNVTLFPAVNATQALLSPFTKHLTIYTQYLLYYHQGRHDHMQLSNAPMLGCLFSHMHLWNTSVHPNETIAIFEEDAYFDSTSSSRFNDLLRDLEGVPWDILMLESGSVVASGQ